MVALVNLLRAKGFDTFVFPSLPPWKLHGGSTEPMDPPWTCTEAARRLHGGNRGNGVSIDSTEASRGPHGNSVSSMDPQLPRWTGIAPIDPPLHPWIRHCPHRASLAPTDSPLPPWIPQSSHCSLGASIASVDPPFIDPMDHSFCTWAMDPSLLPWSLHCLRGAFMASVVFTKTALLPRSTMELSKGHHRSLWVARVEAIWRLLLPPTPSGPPW